jgi:hypothetical protein
VREAVESVVPVLYVADVERSRDFYGVFGFVEQRSGGQAGSRWCYLQCRDHTMLLAAVQPLLITVELPLLLYLYVEDLEAATAALVAAGYPVELTGYPDHAPGGEARTKDCDGNVVLVGQRTSVAPEHRRERTGVEARFSLVKQAAEAVSRRGGAPERCQVGDARGGACSEPAEVKLNDSWGDTVWGCLPHAEEVLLSARGAFVATEDGQGLGEFLRNRHASRA